MTLIPLTLKSLSLMTTKSRFSAGIGFSALLSPAILWGQAEAGGNGNPAFYQTLGENLLFVISGAVILLAFAALFRLSSMMLQLHKMEVLNKYGIPAYEKVAKESWWSRMMKKWSGTVPLEKEEDILMDHNYDGIRELDNSLPPWWVALFYITIAFAVAYIGYYHFSGNWSGSRQEYEMEMKEAEVAVARYLANQADQVDETNVELLTDEASLAAGEAIFLGKCATCHGNLGEGGVGPNMTDEYWIHGGTIVDVFSTVKYGVPAKGMISWRDQLRPQEMQMVSSYILTLQGTDPPNQKAPEGTLFERQAEDLQQPADSSMAPAGGALGMK